MKRTTFSIWMVSLLVILGAAGFNCLSADESSESSQDRPSGYVPGEVIVKLHHDGIGLTAYDTASQGQREAAALHRLNTKYGLEQTDTDTKEPIQRRIYRMKLMGTNRSVLDLCAELRQDPEVALAQPNYIYHFCKVPNDPDFPDQYAHQLIQIADAWDISTGSRDVVVAVLDTGVDIDHPDLEDNIWVNPKEIPDNDIDDDNNGFVDDVHGWNFEDDDNQVNPAEDPLAFLSNIGFHGTMVSGVIAAVGNNGEGVTGVNWECS